MNNVPNGIDVFAPPHAPRLPFHKDSVYNRKAHFHGFEREEAEMDGGLENRAARIIGPQK